MKLFLKPTLDSVQTSLGYEEFDDVDLDDLLFQQGSDADIVEIEDDETFVIPENYIASIIDDGIEYKMLVDYGNGITDYENIYEDLEPGEYKLQGEIIISIEN